MSLLPGRLLVILEPLVDDGLEGIQLRTLVFCLWLGIRLVEVSHVNIFGDCLPVKACTSGDFRYIVLALLIIELPDTMYLIHW